MHAVNTWLFAIGFQHFPWDLANVNEWKIMFDPSIKDLLMEEVSRHVGRFMRLSDINLQYIGAVY